MVDKIIILIIMREIVLTTTHVNPVYASRGPLPRVGY